MHSPSPPPAPDPVKTTQAQLGLSKDTGVAQQGLNMVDQSTPIGSLDYQVIGTNPDGTPKYGATQQYTPEQQALLNTLQGTKGGVGTAASNLTNDEFGLYSKAPDFLGQTNSLTSQYVDSILPNIERFQLPQTEQLDTALRNQGIMPGTKAYQQQMDLQSDQFNRSNTANIAGFVPQAQTMAINAYNTPEQMIEKLMGAGAPADLKSTLSPTPTVTTQTPDYQAAQNAQQEALYKQYQAKVQSQNANMMMGLGLAGGMLGMPATGLTGLGAMGAGLGGALSPVMKGIFGGGGTPTAGYSNDSGSYA